MAEEGKLRDFFMQNTIDPTPLTAERIQELFEREKNAPLRPRQFPPVHPDMFAAMVRAGVIDEDGKWQPREMWSKNLRDDGGEGDG